MTDIDFKTPMQHVLEELQAGKVCGFPTDTVYGCGVSIRDAEGVWVLNRAKGREDMQPCQWLVADFEDVKPYIVDIPDYANELMDQWPGGLTLIFKANETVPEGFRSPESTIAVRVPACNCCRKIIKNLGCPLAASSANMTGEKPPQFIENVSPEFMEKMAYAVSCLKGRCDDATGIPSTIIDCTGSEPKTIR